MYRDEEDHDIFALIAVGFFILFIALVIVKYWGGLPILIPI